MNQTLADSAEKPKQLIIDNKLPWDTQIADVPTCSDGSWSTWVLVAWKRVVTAIAENTSQVIDMIIKSSYCHYRETSIEKRNIDELEDLSLYTKHEVDCFNNLDGSP